MREEQFDRALALYDEALRLETDLGQRELLVIGKADALLAAGRTGPEVNELPALMMRRRSALHTLLAAYTMMFKWRLQNDVRRALFYGETALTAARSDGDPLRIAGVLNELGNIYELDSQFEPAIACFEEALMMLDAIAAPHAREFAKIAIIENLGYSRIQIGDVIAGVDMISSVIDAVPPSARSDAHLEVALGCLRLGDYNRAQTCAGIALELAALPREIRNAHYVLGEIGCRTGDHGAAEHHFNKLLGFFPSFRNMKHVLFAIDLVPMLNFRL